MLNPEMAVMNLSEFKRAFERTAVVEVPHRVAGTPLLSVCIQTFQHGEFIERCLEGVLMQKTTFAFEILVGEDSSSDGTREICVRFAQDFPDRIRLFLHDRKNNIAINGTPTGRFNFAYNLLSAKGKYIALCEGDDFWTDSLKLQRQVDYLESNPESSLSCHNTSLLDNDTDKVIDMRPGVLEETEIQISDLIKSNRLATASFVFRRSIVEDLPKWFVKIPFGDYTLLILSGLSGKIMCLPENMAVYRYHAGGIHSNLFETRDGAIKALKRQFRVLEILQEEVFHATDYERIASRKMRSILKSIYDIHVEAHSYFRALIAISRRVQIRLVERRRRTTQVGSQPDDSREGSLVRRIMQLVRRLI